MEFRTDVTLGLKSPLNPPLMNGGGCLKTFEHVREAVNSLAGAVVIGSFTLQQREGNSGDVFWVGSNGTLNSLGMPNGGYPYLAKHLPEMVAICHNADKPLIVNVAGFSVDEYVELTRVCIQCGADAVELNLGCPNVVLGDGSRKPIPSYDENLFGQIINNVTMHFDPKFPIWVKVSPNFNGDQIRAVAKIVGRYKGVKAVTAINTVPNCYAVNGLGKSRITVGLAGLSGAPLKHIGLGQVMQWRQALPETVEVIAVGGISSGGDIRDYENVGASAFQVTTELLKSGNLKFSVFDRIAMQYLNL